MLARRFLEIHFLAQPVARGRGNVAQRRAIAMQKFLHAPDLAQILFPADRLLARPQAQFISP